jgi:hypothetical protein
MVKASEEGVPEKAKERNKQRSPEAPPPKNVERVIYEYVDRKKVL